MVSNILLVALINSRHPHEILDIAYLIEDIHVYCQVVPFNGTKTPLLIDACLVILSPDSLDVSCVMCFIPFTEYYNKIQLHYFMYALVIHK